MQEQTETPPFQLKNIYTEGEIIFEMAGGNYNLIYGFLKEKDIMSGEISSVFSDPSILFSDQVINYFLLDMFVHFS